VTWAPIVETYAQGWNVMRAVDGGTFTALNDAIIAPGQEEYTFTDTSVQEGKLYQYRVEFVSTYEQGNQFNHDPKRKRKLLLHKREILKLFQQIREKGLTLVPLKFYLNKGLIKVELGLCKGKTKGDKRETLRERQDTKDARRAMSRYK